MPQKLLKCQSVIIQYVEVLVTAREINFRTSKTRGCPGTTCQADVTLTFGLPKQMFQMAHLLMTENNCANLYILISAQNCRSYGLDKNYLQV